MKERPIIFNADMVRAVLDGRKTQTRRIIQERHLYSGGRTAGNWPVHMPEGEEGEKARLWAESNSPFGAVGNYMWVRESYRMPESLDRYSPQQVAEMAHESGYKKPWAPVQLEADGVRTGKWNGFNTPPLVTEPGKLRPSIHMPRWASRITLEITGLRVERLTALSDDCARNEGCPAQLPDNPDDEHQARTWFRGLWSEIYGEESWQANPWVWVIEFKRVEVE